LVQEKKIAEEKEQEKELKEKIEEEQKKKLAEEKPSTSYSDFISQLINEVKQEIQELLKTKNYESASLDPKYAN
jgi:hypothetical protein